MPLVCTELAGGAWHSIAQHGVESNGLPRTEEHVRVQVK
jgi:hypothetical protein